MAQQKIKIVNPTGIHARPASYITKLASQFNATIKIEFKEKEVDAKSIVGVMSLGAQEGDEILIRAEGEQAEEAVQQLSALLNKPFVE